MKGPSKKQNACRKIAASQNAIEVLKVVSEVLETEKGNIFRHKNGTRTNIQKEIDAAFSRFVKERKIDCALDLRAAEIVSKNIGKQKINLSFFIL